MGAGASGDARAAARGSLALIVVQSLGRVLGVVFAVALTRTLEPAELGRYSIVSAVVLVAGFLADFGTTPVIARQVSRRPEDADVLLSGTLLASLALGLASYSLAVGYAVLARYSAETLRDVMIGGLALPATALMTSLIAVLDGRGLIARRSLITFLHVVVLTAGGSILLLAGAGVRGAVLALAVAPLVSMAAAWVVLRRRRIWVSRLRLDWQRTCNLFRSALPYAALAGISAVSLRFDVLALSLLASKAETAVYDLSLRVVEALAYLGTVVSAPSLYLLSRRLGFGDVEGARRAFSTAARFLYLVSLPLSAGLAALHGPVVATLFGERYEGAALPLAILGAQLWLLFLATLQGALILAGDAVGRGVGVAAAITAATVLLDVLLIIPFGAIGAALATAGTQIVAVASFRTFHLRTVGIATPPPGWGILLAAAGCGATAAAAARVSLVFAVAAGAVAYFTLLLATRSVGAEDVRRLRAVLTRPPPGP